MHRDAGKEGGHNFSSKVPHTLLNLPQNPHRPYNALLLKLHPLWVESNPGTMDCQSDAKQPPIMAMEDCNHGALFSLTL